MIKFERVSIVAEKKEKQYVSDNAQLMAEWNWERNIEIAPSQLSFGSNRKVWWACTRGHEWQATVNNRSKGKGCPYCAGKKVLKGYNDLSTTNPDLASEWNYEKNDSLKPDSFTSNSNKKIWWKCKKGHEWQATVANRNSGRGCPVCDSERKTSFPEYVLVFYLKRYGLDIEHSYRKFGYELDIYIPALKIAIEYDGYYWHKNKRQQDLEKNRKCIEDGIKLYRIREGLPSLFDSSVDYVVQENQSDLAITLKSLISEIIGTQVDIDIERDYIEIENLRDYSEKDSSLLVLNPTLAIEWNYEMNGTLRPENFTANSNKKVWWKCRKGHEWQASIGSRNSGCGCPYCSGQKVLIGYNDLPTVNPTLVKEWNWKKNVEYKPEDFTANSSKPVWWKCDKGHEWQAPINNRSKGRGCPFCAGKKVLSGYNDLRSSNPILAAEWNYEMNDTLRPENFTASSNKKVWWKCNREHTWQATIANRNSGTGCPYCSGNKVLKDYNDLPTINPTLAKEWNWKKNGELKPEDFTANSGKQVWWICINEHEWPASIATRNKGHGCPICARKKRK